MFVRNLLNCNNFFYEELHARVSKTILNTSEVSDSVLYNYKQQLAVRY